MYGAVITFPVLFIQYVVQEETTLTSQSFWSGPFSATLEEFIKWIILFIAIFKQTKFQDPYDGILYGASVSLGFATVENILYLISFGIDQALLRAMLPVTSHALFGVVMGYYLGRAQFSVTSVKTYIAISFFAPLVLHTLYNTLLYSKTEQWLIWSVFMLVLWLIALSRVKQAHIFSRKYRMENHPLFENKSKKRSS